MERYRILQDLFVKQIFYHYLLRQLTVYDARHPIQAFNLIINGTFRRQKYNRYMVGEFISFHYLHKLNTVHLA